MPEIIELKNNNNHREYLPSGEYDMAIVSLVHQDGNMLRWMARNIEKYVKGKVIWIAHYNGKEPFDERELPDWAWISRRTVDTFSGFAPSLAHGIASALEFATSHVSFINCMTLSSGSVFIKEYSPPKNEVVCLKMYEQIVNPNKNYKHAEEIHIKHASRCVEYLTSIGGMGWQYGGCDKDIEFHSAIKSRGFEHMRGCQWSGQIWPMDVAKMIAEDIPKIKYPNNSNYSAEEIYLSTYGNAYARKKSMEIGFCEVMIDWNRNYTVNDVEYVKKLAKEFPHSAICKVPTDTNHPVRRFLDDSI